MRKPENSGLPEALARTLDKGVVIDAKLRALIEGQELLGMRAFVVLASLQTGAKIGLKMPDGVDMARFERQANNCPQCGKDIEDGEECPWCGFRMLLGEGEER